MTAKSADVTTAQALEVRRMANSKSIGREQFQAGLGTVIPRALDAIRSGGRIKVLPAIQHPSWGKAVFVDDVPVSLDRDWQMAVNEAGPDTPADYTVRQVGHLYLPTGTGIVRANFALVPLAGGSYRQALAWAQEQALPHASPRHMFGLAMYKPNLHREVLKMDPAYVVSPVEQTFLGEALVCSVWLNGSVRRASADWAQFVGDADGWVAFLRE